MNRTIDRRRFLQGSASLSLLTLPPSPAALRALGLASSTPIPQTASSAATLGHPLLAPTLEHSLALRCLSKPVADYLVLDDMEVDGTWQPSPEVKLIYTTERARSGSRSLRFTTLLRNENFIRASLAPNGTFTGSEAVFFGQPYSAFAVRSFERPQDWSAFNRISLWCYLHPTVSPTTSISLQFLCAGSGSGPWDPLPIHFINDLKPGAWNRLTWEISEYQRDKVVMLVVFKPCSGLAIATPDPSITFDLDQLQLERVEVEPVSSWEVTAGKISYSHIGYTPNAEKLAFCKEPQAQTFRVLNAADRTLVSELPVKQITNQRGRFTVLDLSSVVAPGTYRLECGGSKSEAFPISDDSWNLLLDAVLNSFHGFRCGCAVPGSHDACHLDTFVEYKGDKRCMAGGWHDAANNTEFADSTHLSIYVLLRLYEQLIVDPQQAMRAQAFLEEAKWGLDWSLRMRFAPGVRLPKNFAAYWTDSKVGTIDDVVQTNAGNDLRENIYATVALATSARVLRAVDPPLAAKALKAAEEDYAEFLPSLTKPIRPITYGDAERGSWRDLAAYLTVVAIELYRATGKISYRADSLRFGGWLIALQEQSFVDGSPVTGYFYADPERTLIQREVYGGGDDSGFLALRALCEEFPDDPAWMHWYAGLLIYSEYYCREGGQASAPFCVIPTAVWRRKDLDTDQRPDKIGGAMAVHTSPMFPTPISEEVTQRQRLQMYEAGAPLTPDMRLRVFPIWYNHVQHGSTTGQLNRAAGLGCAAAVRGKFEVAQLTARQLQWVLGANPFSRSIVFGVGYDYWQNFTVDNVNFVGGMGLGLNSYQADMPAWPNNAVFPYKEQWSYSSSRIALNLAQCAAPALITGRASVNITLHEQQSGAVISLRPGRLHQAVPPGRYVASGGRAEWKLDLVGGRTYQIAFDPKQAITLTLGSSVEGVDVTIHAAASGTGEHVLSPRLFNLTGNPNHQTASPSAGKPVQVSWRFTILDKTKPWIVVVVPESSPGQRQEIFGRVGEYARIG